MRQVNVVEAGQRIEELVEQAAAGDEIIITDRSDQPVARITAIPSTRRRRVPGRARGRIRMTDDFDEPLEDFKEHLP